MITEKELKRWMTPAQRREWTAARKSSGDTFMRFGAPDCGSDGTWVPSVDDAGRWNAVWRGTCFDVSAGEPYVFDWDCDTDGNWDYEPRCPLEEYTEAEQEAISLEANQAVREYLQYVLRTGEDPLSEFYVRRTRKVKERWTLRFARTLSGVVLAGARRGDEKFKSPKYIPDYVLQFAGVEPDLIKDPAGPRLMRVRWQWGDVKLARDGRFPYTIDRDVPRPAKVVKSELRKLARRALKVRGVDA